MSPPKKCPDVVFDDANVELHYGYNKDFRTALPQLIAVSVKNLLLLGYGMTLGFQTILIPAVKNPIEGEVLHLNDSEISWISSLNLIAVPIGCAISGIVTTPMGRRRSMQIVNIPFIMAWLLFHFSSTTSHLYGALFITGFAGGLLEAPVLTYVAEITQPHLRGALTATSSMCIIIGTFMQFLFGLFFYWRTVALVNIIFSVLSLISLCFVPESPHWLVLRKRYDDAKKSLQWLRGWTTPQKVEEELRDIQELFKRKEVEADKDVETWMEKLLLYTERSFLVPFFLVSSSFFIGHFSGMTTLQVYAVSIFEMLDVPLDKYYATLILGLLQIFGAGICVVLVHYTGKRPLALVSTAGAAVCCLLVAVYEVVYIRSGSFSTKNQTASMSNLNTSLTTNSTNLSLFMDNPYSWIPTILMMLIAFITHTGIRLLPWILIGEVYSAKTRSGAAGLSSAVGYIFNFLTNKLYLSLVDSLSIWGTYGLYGMVCLFGSILLFFILPETEGRKLNDIENHFAGVKTLTNKVYRSQKRPNNCCKMKNLNGTTNPTFVESTNL